MEKRIFSCMTPAIKILRSLIREIVRGDTSLSLLREGGNAFPGVNSVVPKSLLQKNVENALGLAGLSELKDNNEYSIVGNTQKAYFSDIDIAIDENRLSQFLTGQLGRTVEVKDLLYSKDVTPGVKEYMTQLGVTFKINPPLKTVNILAPLVDEQGAHTEAYDPKNPTNRLRDKGWIQVDFLIGNLGWMKYTNMGAPKESKYKAAHRNQLIDSIMANIPTEEIKLDLSPDDNIEGLDVPSGVELKKKVVYDRRSGIVEKIYYEIPLYKKDGTPYVNPKEVILKTRVSSDPDLISSFFLKRPVSWPEIDSYEKVMAQVDSDNFLYPELREKIKQHFTDYITKYPNSFKSVASA